MAIDFPASPANGVTHTAAGAVWQFDGVKWKANSASAPGDITSVTAGTGLTGGGTSGDVSLALQVPVSVANGGTGAATGNVGPYLPLAAGSGNPLTGALQISPASGDNNIYLQRAAGSMNVIYGRTGANNRWAVVIGSNAAESGSNAGSDFAISRYADGGTLIDTPLSINRASGDVSVTTGINATSANFILSATGGTGAIYIRTYGKNNTTNQAIFGNNGNLDISGNLTVGGTLLYMPSGRLSTGGLTNRAGEHGSFGANVCNLNWDGSSGSAHLWINDTNMGLISIASDYQIKKDIQPLASTWAKVQALRPVSYTQAKYGLFEEDDTERWGFVAHELQETLIQSAATAYKDAPEVQSPNVMTVLAVLTRVVQEAMARIEALEGK